MMMPQYHTQQVDVGKQFKTKRLSGAGPLDYIWFVLEII